MNLIFSIILLSIILGHCYSKFNYNYFNTKEYLKKSRFSKSDLLWKECLKIQKMYEDPHWKYYFFDPHNRPLKFLYSLRGDGIPFSDKLIHKEGLIAKCKFIPSKKSQELYTGIFKTEADTGFVRISVAESFKRAVFEGGSISSGISLKFLRHNMYSANFLTTGKRDLNKLDRENIFKIEQRSFTIPYNFMYVKGFTEVSRTNPYMYQQGFYNNAMYDQNGKFYKNPRFPYAVLLRGGKKMKKKVTYGKKGYIDALIYLKPGAEIFDIYGIADPKTGCEVYIGKIVLKSRFSLSLFADKHLFFHHGHRSLDLNVYPNWIKYTGFIYKFKSYKDKNLGKCPMKLKK